LVKFKANFTIFALAKSFPSCHYHRWSLHIHKIQLSRRWHQLGIPR